MDFEAKLEKRLNNIDRLINEAIDIEDTVNDIVAQIQHARKMKEKFNPDNRIDRISIKSLEDEEKKLGKELERFLTSRPKLAAKVTATLAP